MLARIFRTSSAAAAALSLLLLCTAGDGWSAAPEILHRSRFALGTVVEVSVVSSDAPGAGAALDAGLDEIERIDRLLGTHGRQGELAALNASLASGGRQVSEELFALLGRCRDRWRETGGAFDVTIGGLTALWSFDGPGKLPAPLEIEQARARGGWEKVEFGADRRVAARGAGLVFDLGAVGAGYAADRACAVLRGRGIRAGIVDAGGELRVWGLKPGGEPWRIGLQHPRRAGALLGTLVVTDCGISTSGDYERFFVRDGRRYHHILDPATGYPAGGLQSAAVKAPTAEEADALSTAFMVMGGEKTRGYLRAHPGIEAVLVAADGSVYVSEGWRDLFHEE